MPSPQEINLLLLSLLETPNRMEAAAQLASNLHTGHILIFLKDPEIGLLLPAPGFPQTFPDGLRWKQLLQECQMNGSTHSTLRITESDSGYPAYGVASRDRRAAIVFLGPTPTEEIVNNIQEQLPFLAAALRGEQAIEMAQGQVKVAREAAATSRTLAKTLDTTRAQLQKALGVAERAGRAKDEFLAIVSHELRSPLSAILGWLQILRSEDVTKEDMDHGIEVIERNAKAQAQLIEDIIDFERIVTGKIRLDVKSVDLTGAISAAVETVTPAANAKNIRLQVILDPNANAISGDAGRLQQVTWNMLSNSIKFTPPGGRIQVRLQRINSHVELTVSDTGIGIDAEFLPHIFEQFKQVDSSTTRSQSGLGLGLSIVKHLVELHGGTIEAHSPGKGEGTTMIVKLPVTLAHSTVEVSPKNDKAPPAYILRDDDSSRIRLDGLRVLAVDDRFDARELLAKLLQQFGAEVISAASAREAFQFYLNSSPDILISDIEMPGEDGYSLMRKIRAAEINNGRHIPSIALTAHAQPAERKQAIASGFQVQITKPFEPMELISTINNLRNPPKSTSFQTKSEQVVQL